MTKRQPVVSELSTEDVQSALKKRLSSRRRVYRPEQLEARIQASTYQAIGQLYDASIEGAALLLPSMPRLAKGDMVDLDILFKKKLVGSESAVVVAIGELGTAWRVSLFYHRSTNSLQRRSSRFTIKENFPVCAWCEHPLIFGEKIFLLAYEVSPNGMSFKTSKSNTLIVRGMTVQLHISVPISSIHTVEAVVRHTRMPSTGDRYFVGVEFVGEVDELKNSLGEYVSAFCGNSFDDLRSSGYSVKEARFVRYLFADPSDIGRISELRRLAYASRSAVLTNRNAADFIDEFDAYSRHVIAVINSKLVAAIRVVFTNGDSQRSELMKVFSVSIPPDIISSGFVELSKLCIDEKYGKASVFTKIIREAMRIGIQDGAQYAVCLSVKGMIPVYKKIGFQLLSSDMVAHPDGVELYPLFLKLENLFDNSSIDPSLSLMYQDLASYLFGKT